MALVDLWQKSNDQLVGKTVNQIITFAGAGKLLDKSLASSEFRQFLSHIKSDWLTTYLDQCLQGGFDDSGFALQDIVNQIGRRIGFEVTDGRYRGIAGQIGYDGIWKFADGHAVIVEVKTTDAYQINLDTIAKYRRDLINSGNISEEHSSILIILGRGKDTSGLEAQIRGSRHSWNIRLLSVDALVRLMQLKEAADDPQIIGRISTMLIPHEFTKLDEIIEYVFFTAEDVKESELEEDELEADPDDDENVQTAQPPSAFNDACVKRLEKHLKQSLIKRSRTGYSSSDDSIRLTCAVSKAYQQSSHTVYWFAFHKHHKEFLESAKTGYVAFGCGSEQMIVSISATEFLTWLDQFNTTEKGDRLYWHVHIVQSGSNLVMRRKQVAAPIDLTPYIVHS